MEKYILRSKKPCLIKYKDKEEYLDENSYISFNSDEIISIYPINNISYTSFYYIDLANLNDNDLYTSIKYNNSYLIILNFKDIIKQTFIENIKIANKECKIKIFENNISFEIDNIKKNIQISDLYLKYYINTIDQSILLLLTGNKEALFIFNTNSYEIKKFEGKKIEIINNKILITKEIYAYNTLSLYETFEISNNKVNLTNSQIKYENEREILNYTFIPIIFIESLLYRDYEKAKSLLSSTLKDTTDSKTLDSYFGEFNDYIYIDNNIIGLIYPTKILLCEFIIKNNCIEDFHFIE